VLLMHNSQLMHNSDKKYLNKNLKQNTML